MNTEAQPDQPAAVGSSPFFRCPEWDQCLDLISHLTENSTRIPLIKGPPGSGKTTLLFQLQSQTPGHWMLCRIDANPMMHPEQFYVRLARHFGVAEQSDPLKQELLAHLESLRDGGALPVIAIDDAQLLPMDTVAELLQLQNATTATDDQPLHLILFATAAIDAVLEAQGPGSNAAGLIQTLEIPPLKPEQAAAYILERLRARPSGATAFTSEQIDRIVQESQGLPGRIEQLLAKPPGRPAAAPRKAGGRFALKPLLEDLPLPAILGALGLLLIVSVLLLFQEEINALFYGGAAEERPEAHQPARQNQIRLPLPPPRAQTAESASAVEPAPVEEPAPVSEMESEAPPPPETKPQAPPEPVVEGPGVAPQPTPVVAPEGEKAAPPPPETKPQTPPEPVAEEPGAAPRPAPAVASKGEKAAPPPPEMKPQTTPEPVAEKPEAPPPAAPKPPAAAQAAPPGAQPPPPPRPVRDGPKREAWLLAQKPTAYTLQIIGLTDRSGVSAYIRRHRLAGKVAYFKVSRNGKPWYPLLYGLYPDRAAAVAARPGLASRLRRKDIWPRSLASVQEAIRAEKPADRGSR